MNDHSDLIAELQRKAAQAPTTFHWQHVLLTRAADALTAQAAELSEAREERDSWRRVAERCESEKQAAQATIKRMDRAASEANALYLKMSAERDVAREEIERLTRERDEAVALAAAQNGGNRFASAEWTKTLLKLRDAQKERDAILAAGEALSLALSRYGFPMSDEAWRNTGDDAPVNSQASVEARALHRAAAAYLRAISGGFDGGK